MLCRIVSRTSVVVVALIGMAAWMTAPASAQEPPTLEFRNASWYDGSGFTPGVRYSVAGRLTRERPARVDRTVDLEGGFVLPAYGDAHTHHFDGPFATRS